MHPSSPKPPTAKRKLVGFKQRIERNEQRARENAGKPDNVVSRKGFVVAVYALVVYAYYVFVGRLCVPMLQRKRDARGSVGQGVGLMIAFHVLWLMFIWTYSRIAFISPGWASQLVPKAQGPEESMITTTNTGTPYQYIGTQQEPSITQSAATPFQIESPNPQEGPSQCLTPAQQYAFEHRRSITSLTSGASDTRPTHDDPDALDRDPSDLDAARNMLPPEIPFFNRRRSGTTASASVGLGMGEDNRVSDVSNVETCDSHTPLQPIPESTQDSTPRDYGIRNAAPGVSESPVDGRQQGTQQPVHGVPPNPKTATQEWLYERPLPPHYPGLFFIIFCGWSTLFTAYIAVVLAVKMGTEGSLDGQMLALVIIGGFFTVFTFTMTLSHIAMASTALTTIESFTTRDQRDRESHLLAQKYGFFKWRTKTQTLKRWNHEYGDLKTEGNRWYVGGPMREWRLLMGDDPVGWILPIGHAKADGLAFEQNPRFGAHGERRKREAWPEHLR
ncbi:hypothetical protein QFC20_005458 [Naganishia adeliensis]|uniref:Uncharacterized protein n=1 Tax=Naganishia adeliensis TaxID=92952 RepID=A0ACC2VMJ5_9TREE|nr:hypothetical protein QFC20_005458 [Naganishia adeliensis]